MSAKLDRIGEERDKALRRRGEWEARYKELEKKYRGKGNTEGLDLVQAVNLPPEKWGQVLRQTAQSLPSPEAVNQVVKEDTTDED